MAGLKRDFFKLDYLTIGTVARKGRRPIAHEGKPNGLLTIGA